VIQPVQSQSIVGKRRLIWSRLDLDLDRKSTRTVAMSTPTTPPQAKMPLLQSTPFKTGSSTTYPYTTTHKFRIERCSALADEIGPYIVGPMPAQQFLDDFFPVDDIPDLDSVPLFTPGCYDSTVEAKKEILAYKPFVSPLNSFFCFSTVVVFSRSRQLRRSPLASKLLIHLNFLIAILGWTSHSRSNLISLSIVLTHQSPL
jgi:hypothetical protein